MVRLFKITFIYLFFFFGRWSGVRAFIPISLVQLAWRGTIVNDATAMRACTACLFAAVYLRGVGITNCFRKQCFVRGRFLLASARREADGKQSQRFLQDSVGGSSVSFKHNAVVLSSFLSDADDSLYDLFAANIFHNIWLQRREEGCGFIYFEWNCNAAAAVVRQIWRAWMKI